VLLADHILSQTDVEQPLVINSIVSSPMLAAVAAHHGAAYATTLTGFKWIWNAALDLEAETANRFVFGYEEALGYSVAPMVRDKDGISAAVVFADLVAGAAERGETVRDLLAGLYRRDGMWVSAQRSIVRTGTEGAAEIAAAIEALAEDPPTEIDGVQVVEVVDYRSGAEQRPRYLGATSLVALDLGEVGRVLVRPSGTEPKLKIYIDLRTTLAADAPVDEVESALTTRALALGDAMAHLLGLT
jgi:phosphomannomutase